MGAILTYYFMIGGLIFAAIILNHWINNDGLKDIRVEEDGKVSDLSMAIMLFLFWIIGIPWIILNGLVSKLIDKKK
jgi:hypothetical protein